MLKEALVLHWHTSYKQSKYPCTLYTVTLPTTPHKDRQMFEKCSKERAKSGAKSIEQEQNQQNVNKYKSSNLISPKPPLSKFDYHNCSSDFATVA